MKQGVGDKNLVFVSVVVVALFLVAVLVLLSSSVAEESGEDDDEDEDTDCDTDDDVQGAVVAGGGGDSLNVAVFVNGQSFAGTIIDFSSSSVADALWVVVEVQYAGTITAVSVALISWINDEDGFQSAFITAVTFGGTSSSSTGGACDGLAGTNTDVDRHINFKGKAAGWSVHGETHLSVSVRCVDGDSKAGGLGGCASILKDSKGAGASW